MAVPKAKAAAVAYKEREKGRSVATATNVSGATYDTTIFPLPYNVPVEVSIQIVSHLDDKSALSLDLPLVFAQPVQTITVTSRAEDGSPGHDNLQGAASGSRMADGLRVTFPPPSLPSFTTSALRNGSLFWSGCVPKAAINEAFSRQQASLPHAAHGGVASTTAAAKQAHVGLIVDVSRSSAPMAEQHLKLLESLQESFAAAGRGATYTLWSVSRRAQCRGQRLSAAEVRDALKAVRYDGGTNASLYTGLLSEAEEKGCDSIVLMTDGVSNLLAKELPSLESGNTPPVHIPLPPQGVNANLGLLRWMAHQTGGSASVSLSNPKEFGDLISGASVPTLLTKLEPDNGGDLEVWTDDEFTTCPDFRLSACSVPVRSDGAIRFSGSCNPTNRPPPASVTLHIRRGTALAALTVPITPPSSQLPGDSPGDDGPSAMMGRLLEVQHTLLRLAQLQVEHWDPEATAKLSAELACACGVASEHSSLLKLSLPEQFADNGISCPPGHDAHAEWKKLLAQREKDREARDAAAAAKVQQKLSALVEPMANKYHGLVTRAPARWGKRAHEQSGRGDGGGSDADADWSYGCDAGFAYRGMAALGAAAEESDDDDAMLCADGESNDEDDEEVVQSGLEDLRAFSLRLQPSTTFSLRRRGGPAGAARLPPPPAATAPTRLRGLSSLARPCAPGGAEPPAAAPAATAPRLRGLGSLMGGGPPAPSMQLSLMGSRSMNSIEGTRSMNSTDVTRSMGSMEVMRSTEGARPMDSMQVESSCESTREGSSASAPLAPAAPPPRYLPLPPPQSGGPPPPPPAPPSAALAPNLAKQKKTKPTPDALSHLAPWLQAVGDAYEASGVDGALTAFDAHLDHNPALCELPSTFISASEVLHAHGADSELCADVLFNVLEAKLPEAQVCRVVAYHLLSLGRFDEAVLLLELIRETLAPAEPHSFTDLAFARFHRLRNAPTIDPPTTGSEMAKVVADLTAVLTSTEWPSRFREIEWPVLILLSWAVAWAENKLPSCSLWPEAELPAATYRLGGSAGPQLDVFVWLVRERGHARTRDPSLPDTRGLGLGRSG